jgi:hypothetical protein
MAYRIDIEITSVKDENTFTWRKQGAKQPKGIVDKSLLGSSTKVGDIFKVEIEQSLDGIDIVAVIDSKKKAQGLNTPVIEIGIKKQSDAKVTLTKVKGKTEKKAAHNKDFDRSHKNQEFKAEYKKRSNSNHEKKRSEFLRINWVKTDSFLETLSAQEKPIAELLIKGGMPSVRNAIKVQNEQAKANNLPEVAEAALLAIAEKLMPEVRKMQWLDRANSALEAGSKCPIRELKSLLASVDLKDETIKTILSQLKGLLKEVVEQQIKNWKEDMTKASEAGDIKRSLELLSSPPDRTATLDSNILEVMVKAVNDKFRSDLDPDNWIELVESLANSTLRTKITIEKIPFDATEATLATAKKYSGFIPSLAPLLGLKIPPPPRISKSTMIISQ